jgi:hypothetical protein
VLVVALGLGALLTFGPRVDGRSFGGFLAHAVVCAVRGGCDKRDGDDALVAAYGEDDAELVRRFAPNIVYEPRTRTLPVDFRECRAHRCSDAPDDRDLDVHRSNRGRRATVFTHVVRSGGETFLQYWFYYPDSTSTYRGVVPLWNGSALGAVADYPGYHADDWESYHVRIGRDGEPTVRASSHHWYQGCKVSSCKNDWVPWTGWTRVSWGSHAGHIPAGFEIDVLEERDGGRPRVNLEGRLEPRYPGVHLRERTSTADGLRLVPIETLDTGSYVPLDPRHKPPWHKKVYTDPRSNSTG